MIGNITTGSNFKPLMYYLLKESKNATILGGSVLSRCAATIAREFGFIAEQRPTTKKPVKHYSIGFAPSDGIVSNELKQQIAADIVRGMGFTKEITIEGQQHQEINNQYLVVDHHRHDPAHPKTHNHDHIHIAINLVNYDLERVNDGWDKRRLEKVLRQLELKYNLTPVLSSTEYAKKLSDKKAAGSDPKFRRPLDYLKNVLQQQWAENLSFDALKERLARFGIKIDSQKPNKLKGRYQFTYQIGNTTFIKSDLKDNPYLGTPAPIIPATVEDNADAVSKPQKPIPIYVVDRQKQSLLGDMKQAIADAVDKHTLDKPDFATFSNRMKQNGIEVILYQTAGRKRKGRYKLKYRYQNGIEIRAGKNNGGSLNDLIQQGKICPKNNLNSSAKDFLIEKTSNQSIGQAIVFQEKLSLSNQKKTKHIVNYFPELAKDNRQKNQSSPSPNSPLKKPTQKSQDWEL